MKGLNKVTLIGNLGGVPQITNFENGGKKAEFTIATQDAYKEQGTGEWKEITDWHRCYATGKLAETIEKYLEKGMRIYLEGKLKTRSWDDAQKGKQYVTEVKVMDFMFLTGKKDDGMTATPTAKVSDKEDDDLPF